VADSRKMSLAQRWNEYLCQQGKSEHTVRAYQQGLSHFIRWYEGVYHGDFDPSLVMPRDVRDWKRSQLAQEKASPASVNQRLVAVNSFFTWAVGNNICRENPAGEIDSVPLTPLQPKRLKTTELRRLLRAAYSHPRDYAMLEMMAGSGLRVGELLALRIGDLKFNERSGAVIVRQGKQGNYREIPLTADVRKAVLAYLKTAHPDPENPHAALWQGRQGELTQRSSVKRMLEKYARIAQITPPSPHVLRHTFATRYLAANPGDLRGLARLLGHASLNTVMIYTEPDMDTLIERMQRVDMLTE
jgi:site-specific recombinase XerD